MNPDKMAPLKPADLYLQCFQKKDILEFSRTLVNQYGHD